MPKEMTLQGTEVAAAPGPADAVGLAFAARALAVVRVHDSEEGKAKNLTLRDICAKDDYLADRVETLSAHLFRAFGRHCVPVLENFLAGVYSAEEIEAQVQQYTADLRSKLDL